MKTILYVHPASDMYGSSRILLSLVQGLDKKYFRPIIFLPCSGPLVGALASADIEAHVVPLAIIGRATLNPLGLTKLPFKVLRSIHAIDKALDGTKIDIVHSNTLAVLSGALWAMWRKVPHVWHIHEIVEHPNLAKRLFPWLVRLFSEKIVCNSNATRRWLLDIEPCLANKIITIWNGLERTTSPDKKAISKLRKQIGLNNGDILVVLVGRINRLKGQGLLVEAAELLWKRGQKNIHYLIVGSTPPGQDYFRGKLLSQIDSSSAKSQISVMGFLDDIWTIWDACDIAVVPSTEPESFGMVAVEAMAAGKPVIAAAHGGLIEIVLDSDTGILFQPGNPIDLADAIFRLAMSAELRNKMGERGLIRQKNEFSLNTYIEKFMTEYQTIGGNYDN